MYVLLFSLNFFQNLICENTEFSDRSCGRRIGSNGLPVLCGSLPESSYWNHSCFHFRPTAYRTFSFLYVHLFFVDKNWFDCTHVSSKSDNHLNGTIPESIYTVSTLESLLLSGNNLVGTISPEINKLTNLYKLGKQHKSSSPHWFIFLTPTRPLP